jgi:hypothetical protein
MGGVKVKLDAKNRPKRADVTPSSQKFQTSSGILSVVIPHSTRFTA